MPLDPQIGALIEQSIAAGFPPYHTLSPEEARRIMALRAALGAGELHPVARVEDRQIPGPDGWLPIRVYTPAETAAPRPILVFFHGGGFVLGSLETHDPLCRALAHASGCLVVSVGYRLAPEQKFPAAVQDGYAATRWLAEHAGELSGDPLRIAVAGDSAGGNLAAVVALMARDLGGPAIRQQILIYPVIDHAFDTPSYRDNGTGYLLSRDDMVWFWGQYLAEESDGNHPYASPLRAESLRDLPPALVITAEYDPLRDEGEAYAGRLREAGVPVLLSRYDGMVHGFLRYLAAVEGSRRALRQIGAILREELTQ